jgi:hypothetical protein
MIHYLIELDSILRDLVMWYGDIKGRNNRSFSLTHLFFEFDGNLEIKYYIDDDDNNELIQGTYYKMLVTIVDNIAVAYIDDIKQTDTITNSFKKFQKLCNDALAEYNSLCIELNKQA